MNLSSAPAVKLRILSFSWTKPPHPSRIITRPSSQCARSVHSMAPRHPAHRGCSMRLSTAREPTGRYQPNSRQLLSPSVSSSAKSFTYDCASPHQSAALVLPIKVVAGSSRISVEPPDSPIPSSPL